MGFKSNYRFGSISKSLVIVINSCTPEPILLTFIMVLMLNKLCQFNLAEIESLF